MPTESRPRTSYLGGPDLAAIVGASRYRGPFAVYLAKVQGVETPDSRAMEWGRRLEQAVAQKYVDETGHAHEQGQTIFHPEFPFIGGTPDFLCASDLNLLLEVKTAAEEQLRQVDDNGEPLWGPDGTDEIPLDYLVQVTVYMGLTGRRRADLAVLFLGARREFRTYHLEFDRNLYDLVIAKGVEFWQAHVVPRVPPPQDLIPSDLVNGYLARQAQAGGATLEMPAQMLAVALDLEEIGRARKEAEEREEALKAKLLSAMAAMGAQKVQGQAYGAKFSLAIQGGEEGKPWTNWQVVAFELARRLGLSAPPEDLVFDHTRTAKPKNPFLMPYFTAVRNAIKKAAAQGTTTSIPA
jgi:putative phage-type endonuclease